MLVIKDLHSDISDQFWLFYGYKYNNGNKKTIKEDILGNTIIEDNNGNRKTVKKDIFGNTIIEDNKGHKQIIKKDIFGNSTIEDYEAVI